MSAIKDRRIYTKEFKQDALNLSSAPGYTLALAARKLGIAEKISTAGGRSMSKTAP